MNDLTELVVQHTAVLGPEVVSQLRDLIVR